MHELIKLGDRTYCIKSFTNVGIYLLEENNVCLIDTGESSRVGEIIDNILIENNWHLKYIINTHSHADHIGGNKYLQEKYKCEIYSSKVESYFINETLLEPTMLYGAVPIKDLCNPVIMADDSKCEDIKNLSENGLKIINLEGHSHGLIGVITSDEVCFVGDAYTSGKILSKYAIQYIYDVDKYLKTIDFLKNTNYKFYVPSHGEIEENPKNTLMINKEVVLSIEKQILDSIEKEITFSKLIKKIFEEHHISMNIVQYHVIGVTIKSFLTRLINADKLEIIFDDNTMKIKKII